MVFHGTGSLFYLFAFFVFLAGPLVAGFIAASGSEKRKIRAFCTSGILAAGIALVLFFITYAIAIVFFITTVHLPASCDSTCHSSSPPAELGYRLPDGTSGIIVTGDADTLIVARIAYEQPQRPGTGFLVNRSDGIILWSTSLPGDTIAAAMDNDTAYVFSQGIGEFIDRRSGRKQPLFVSMDNYGTNTHGDFQTTGIISFWKKDGTVQSLRLLTFNGIVRGCYIRGSTGGIMQL